VTASPNGNSEFAQITRKSEIINKDVEVNFGESRDDFVTLTGRVLDREGQPISYARVDLLNKVTLIDTDLIQKSQSVKCNKDGAFKVFKLLPGRYDVNMEMPEFEAYINWGELVFNKPGTYEKDLSFVGNGAAVRGAVVAAPGTELPDDTYLGVYANNEQSGKQYGTKLNLEYSTFYFHHLPAGSYTFIYSDCDPVRGVKLIDGQVIDNLRLIVNPKGELRMLLEGFTDEELKPLFVIIGPIMDRDQEFALKEREQKWTLNEGDYHLYLAMSGLGAVDRDFHISPKTTTDLVFHADDVRGLAPQTIKGSLKLSSGAPVPGVDLNFSTHQYIIPKGYKMSCKTDEEGLFVLNKMAPGRWSVQCNIEFLNFDKKCTLTTYIHDLAIPSKANPSFTLDLVLSSGAISGRIVDKNSGAPITEQSVKWRVWLGDVNMRWMGELYGDLGSAFEFNHVSPGDYIIYIYYPGFERYTTKPFFITPGQVLDLGDIPLSGCGIIEIEVKNRSGEAIWFRALCNNKPMSGSSVNQKKSEMGKKLFTQLPLGEAIIEVFSHGYKSEKLKVELLPAKKVALLVVLKQLK